MTKSARPHDRGDHSTAKGPPSWRKVGDPDRGPRPQQGYPCSCAGRYPVSYTHLTLPTICSV
eukprot:15109517-Alexandrium_andersonii.AAC.1